MAERRNARRRTETLKRLIAWFRNQTTETSDVPPEVAPRVTARRILSRLTLRGLARRTDKGWLPQPALVSPAPVQDVEPDL